MVEEGIEKVKEREGWEGREEWGGGHTYVHNYGVMVADLTTSGATFINFTWFVVPQHSTSLGIDMEELLVIVRYVE